MRDAIGYDRAVRSWAHHLRSGGTIPWRAWAATTAPEPPGVSTTGDEALPGAAQLELVRRLALRTTAGPGFAAVADLALGRSGPGRGLAQQPLAWDGPVRPFGPPPVDPVEVPTEELVRVGVGVLAELLLLPAPELSARPEPWRRPWTRTPAFVLAGAPVTVAGVRRALAAAGHVEGGRAPRVVLLAEPLDVALFQVWSTRVQAGAPVRWRGFVERCARGRELPDSVDLAGTARHWADRVGPAAVHVVAAPQPMSAARTVADVLGVRLAAERRDRAPRRRHGQLQDRAHDRPHDWRHDWPHDWPHDWADLGPEAVDVVRRVNAVLGVRAGSEVGAPARRRLVAALAEAGGHAPQPGALTVPSRFRGWAHRRAATLVEQLTAGDYAVHGSLGALAPRIGTRPAHPRADGTLDVVLDACLQQAVLAGLDPTRAKEH